MTLSDREKVERIRQAYYDPKVGLVSGDQSKLNCSHCHLLHLRDSYKKISRNLLQKNLQKGLYIVTSRKKNI